MEKVKMEKLSICRICLDDNVCVNLVNNAQLQDIFERLTSTPFQTNDMRPLTLCYVCHAQLNTIHRFTVKCRKAEEILTDMLSQIHTVIQGNRVVPKLTVIRRAVLNQLVYTETQLIDIDSSVPNVETVDVKEEIQINFEGAMKWEDQSLQGPSKMTDSEQEDEEVPPDPMESMPLTNMKTERDEEVDGTGKSLMKAARNATKPKRVRKETTGVKIVNVDIENDQAEASNPKDNIHNLVLNAAPNAKQPKPVVSKSKRNVKVESKLNDTIEILILNDKIQINGKNYINITSNSGVTATNEAVNDSKGDVDKYKFQKTVQESSINDVQNKSGVYGKSRVCLRAKKELICDVCKQSFNHKSKLKSHIRMSHTLKTPQLCNICHKTFSNKYSLKAHTLIHSGAKPYACDVCPKSFNRKDSLIIHTRSHSGEKPYVCAVCKKGFPDKSHLITHSRIHSDESPHVCDECGNSYTTKSSLVQHKNTHTGEKPFMCNVCNKGFTQKGYLKIHSRTHTGDKPYVCDVCGKGFTHNSSLHVHSRSHTGQKPYSCEVCWKTFTLKHALVRHSRIHTGERQFACNICNKSFSKRQNLLAHTRNQKCEKRSTRLL